MVWRWKRAKVRGEKDIIEKTENMSYKEEKESETYKDMIVIDTSISTSLFLEILLAIFKWGSHTGAPFVARMNDNVYAHIPPLVSAMMSNGWPRSTVSLVIIYQRYPLDSILLLSNISISYLAPQHFRSCKRNVSYWCTATAKK